VIRAMTPRPSYITMNNAINRSSSNGMDDDVMNSLGKVLSSVNLVGEDSGMSYGGHGGGQHQHNGHHGGQSGYYGSNSWNGASASGSGGTSTSG
jgi:hypothetical protein